MAKLFLIAALLIGTAQAQDAPAALKSTNVAAGITMLEGAGGNITLLAGDEYNVLLDDGYGQYTAALFGSLGELADGPIDFVINTHVHGDHVGSNAALAETGAVVYAHDNIRKRLLQESASAGGPGGLPVVTFSDQVTFHVNGIEAFVFHIEDAHTDGDAAIEFRGRNVIYAGDLFFNYLFPFIDLDTGGNVAGYIAAQRRIIAMSDDDTAIIPGHGVLANKADLQAAVDMLVDAESRVKTLVDAGKTEQEILAANPLADYHDTWNWRFITTERMTSTLYRSLTSD